MKSGFWALLLVIFAAALGYEHARLLGLERQVVAQRDTIEKLAKSRSVTAAPIAPVATEATRVSPPRVATEPIVEANYLIQPHDTLWGIARRLYGKPSLYKQLAAMNDIPGPDYRIFAGHSLRLAATPAATRPRIQPRKRPIKPSRVAIKAGNPGSSDDDEELPEITQEESIVFIRLIAKVPRLVESIGLPSVLFRLKSVSPDAYPEALRTAEDKVLENSHATGTPPEINRNDSGEEVPPRTYDDLNRAVAAYYEHYQKPELNFLDEKLLIPRIKSLMWALNCRKYSLGVFRDSPELAEAAIKLYFFDLVNQHGGNETLDMILKEDPSLK